MRSIISSNLKKIAGKAAVILFWLVVWQLASIAVKNHIVLVGPIEALNVLIRQIGSWDFWYTIFHSFSRIAAGFFLAFILGILTAVLSYRIPLIEELWNPIILLLQSVPVASFVIMALIWIGSGNLAVFVSFTVVVPLIYINVLEGLRSTDVKMIEMANIFRMGPVQKVLYLYRPAVLPFLISGCRTAIGMSWKSGIAAEVIGVPAHSIGEKLYMAKIYLSTADLFAWTFVIIMVSMVFEHVFMYFLRWIGTGKRKSK